MKREALIRDLAKYARKHKLSFEVEKEATTESN